MRRLPTARQARSIRLDEQGRSGEPMGLTAAQMAQMSRLLDEALKLDTEGRRRWLEALDPQHQDLVPALRRALLPEEGHGTSADAVATLPEIGALGGDTQGRGSLRAGELVGPYQLIRFLGQGGMAEVWLAQRADGAFKREVALKVPKLSRLRKDLASRFARERDILAALEHPNIARMYDAGVSADGLPYLAMEYVPGEQLLVWCDAKRLTLDDRLGLFLQILDAVQYAHGRQVIHRDIKPSNILVTDSRQVRLLDFGVAKLLAHNEEETDLTQQYGRALTPEYVSPELVRGERIGAASDVYSLGVVLYELLAGSRPYRIKAGASVALLEQAIASAQVERPSTRVGQEAAADRSTTREKLVQRLQGDLDAIVLKALAKAPEDRYASATAMASQVKRSLILSRVRLSTEDETILDVNRAIEALEQTDARLAQVAQMRYFGGYTEREIAETLGVTECTVQQDWEKACAMLKKALDQPVSVSLKSTFPQLLEKMHAGDAEARNALFALAYEELRRLAQARLFEGRRNRVLETNSPVHEWALRFVEAGELRAEDRRAFFAFVSQVMRSVILHSVRERQSERGGGDARQLTLSTEDEETILEVSRAIEALKQTDARLAQVVEMRYFGGYTEREIAEALGVTEHTVQQDWEKARAILKKAHDQLVGVSLKGTTFGKYRLFSEIGHGSSARVYTASRDSESDVALKVFDLGKIDSNVAVVRRFFENELKAVRSLDHPNIVKYLDAGTVGEIPYIAMELLAGGSLERRLERAAYLSVEDVVAMLEPIADAIDYAHRRRVLHRDIKPSNILFSEDGRPVLSDFGIAHILPPREQITATIISEALGTSDFMAPEVMNEAPTSPASDLYSLGITVYYALAGKFPADGTTLFRRSSARVEGRVIPLADRNPAVPSEVSRVVMTAIATDPKNRYQSARAFGGALRLSASGAPGTSRLPDSMPLKPVSSRVGAPEAPGSSDPIVGTPGDGGKRRTWLDYWRYVIVPIIVAIVGAIAAWWLS
jgi:RNA polymerase sigma factor (TIGR02999 family)